MKDIKPNAAKDFEFCQLREIRAESEDTVDIAERKRHKFLENHDGGYRIWHCNGLPIKVRVIKKRP